MEYSSIETVEWKAQDDDHVATLVEIAQDSKAGRVVPVFKTRDFFIGRDKKTCQCAVTSKNASNKHVRIYTVIFEEDVPGPIPPLVYAEVLSASGILWNNNLIFKGQDPVLLSDGDSIQISHTDNFLFRCASGTKGEFSAAQVNDMTFFQGDFDIAPRVLGRGAFGQVHTAWDKKNSRQLACKIVNLAKVKQDLEFFDKVTPDVLGEQPRRADIAHRRREREDLVGNIWYKIHAYDREFQILQMLSHPNVISLERVIKTNTTIYIFQELLTGGDLFSYLEHKGGVLVEIEAAVIVRQIVIALAYLHKRGVTHRDIKPDNVLLSSMKSGARVVVTDFGCARQFDRMTNDRMQSVVGTTGYIAPEVELGRDGPQGGYTEMADMWSLGCLTGILLTGSNPFTDPDKKHFSEHLSQTGVVYHNETDPTWTRLGDRSRDFVRRLLKLNPDMRMTANEALVHPWFTNATHKREFETLYQRAVKSWHDRKPVKGPVVQDFSVDNESFLHVSPPPILAAPSSPTSPTLPPRPRPPRPEERVHWIEETWDTKSKIHPNNKEAREGRKRGRLLAFGERLAEPVRRPGNEWKKGNIQGK